MKGKPSKLSKARNEVDVLKTIVNRLIYVLAASKYELERLVDEGGSVSENIKIIREDYSEILKILGIETIDPREAAKSKEIENV